MRTFDARAWLVWLLAGGLLAIVAGNPLYLLLLLIISRVVALACAPLQGGGWRFPFWRVSLMILLFSTLFNMLTAHIGQTTLATLPAGWPLIGGPLTLEAALFGFVNGLRLITLLSFFLAFNAIVPVSELAGLTPRALHELGLVMLIAITYVPETARQFQRIREAQAIRGHRLSGLRDWQPVVIPLLIAGLERALNLSETMVARGYGSTAQVATPLRARLLLLLGLLLALAGALRLLWNTADGWWLLAGAALAIGGAYVVLSRLAPRSRYQPRRWRGGDTLLLLGALLPLLLLLPWPWWGRAVWGYSPYPRFAPPPFQLGAGLALLGLAVPALLALRGEDAGEVMV